MGVQRSTGAIAAAIIGSALAVGGGIVGILGWGKTASKVAEFFQKSNICGVVAQGLTAGAIAIGVKMAVCGTVVALRVKSKSSDLRDSSSIGISRALLEDTYTGSGKADAIVREVETEKIKAEDLARGIGTAGLTLNKKKNIKEKIERCLERAKSAASQLDKSYTEQKASADRHIKVIENALEDVKRNLGETVE